MMTATVTLVLATAFILLSSAAWPSHPSDRSIGAP